MATRVGYVGTESIGDVLTKANYDKGPGGLVGYLAITSTSAATGGTATVTGLSLAFTAGTSRLYKITIECSQITTTGTGGTSITIWDTTGAAQIAAGGLVISGGALGAGPGDYPGRTVTAYHAPAAGAQTYSFRTVTTATTAAVAASATGPAKILVEDVGPAF